MFVEVVLQFASGDSAVTITAYLVRFAVQAFEQDMGEQTVTKLRHFKRFLIRLGGRKDNLAFASRLQARCAADASDAREAPPSCTHRQ